jgi:hypothetical protein
MRMLKMKRREPDTIWAILLALALFTIVSCVLDEDKTAKRGSEVENELYGVLVAMAYWWPWMGNRCREPW